MTPEQALINLLCSLFDDDQLHIFFRHGPDGSAIAPELPGPGASRVAIVGSALMFMKRKRYSIPAFFDRLLHERPARKDEIEAIRRLYPQEGQPSAAFSESPPRGFISLDEHRDVLVSREVLARAYDLPLQGRAEDLARIREFVEKSPNQVLLIHGPGGVGKSRLQYEAARGLRDEGLVEAVYCGTPHLEAGGDWDVGATSETRVLAILDDPKEPRLIERLLAALHGPWRLWKVILTAPTPRDPVLTALQDRRNRVLEIELGPLSVADATNYSASLLATFEIPADIRSLGEKRLARACGYFPIWMTVAAKLLETQEGDLNNLPEDRFGLAQRYIRDVLDHTRAEIGTAVQIMALLRWIALVQPVNRQDEETGEFLRVNAELTGAGAVERAIGNLVRRRVASTYGVEQRMIEIRPDVMRDHLLVEWLTSNDGGGRRRVSMDAIRVARSLAAEIRARKPSRRMERIMVAFLRVEDLVEQPLPFLDPVVDATVELAEAASGAQEQAMAVTVAQMFASRRPSELTRVITAICARDVPSTDLEYHRVTREQVLAMLPQALHAAARGCSNAFERKAVLQGFIALVDREEASAGDARGGVSASEQLGVILHEYHGYRSSFRAEAGALADDFLARLARGEVPRESWRVVVEAMSAIERRDGFASEDNADVYTFETRRISSKSEDGRMAVRIREGLWALATTPMGSVAAKLFAWALLDKLHGSMIWNRGVGEWGAFQIDDLRRCLACVSAPGVAVDDLQAARAIWDWHLKYGEEAESRRIAAECEAVYLRHPETGRYARIFVIDTAELTRHFEAEVRGLPKEFSCSELVQFFTGALAFTRGHAEKWRAQYVNIFASILGEERRQAAAVAAFTRQEIARGMASPLFDVALRMAAGGLHGLRGDGDEAKVMEVLQDLFACAPDARARVEIVSVVYVQMGRLFGGRFGAADKNFLEKHRDVVAALPLKGRFSLMGRLLPVDVGLLGGIEGELAGLSVEGRIEALGALWIGYYETLPYPLANGYVSPEIVGHLRDLSADQPVLDGYDEDAVRAIRKLLKCVPKQSIRWLLDLVKARLLRFHRLAGKGAPRMYVRAFLQANSWLMGAVDTFAGRPPSAQEQQGMVELLDLAGHEDVILDELAEFIVAIDPNGRVAPALVASRLNALPASSELESVVRWSRFAGHYPFAGASWRVVAKPACERAEGLSKDDTESVFASLVSPRTGARGSRLDKHRERRRQRADEVASAMNAEEEVVLRPFWRWLHERVLAAQKEEEALREEWRM